MREIASPRGHPILAHTVSSPAFRGLCQRSHPHLRLPGRRLLFIIAAVVVIVMSALTAAAIAAAIAAGGDGDEGGRGHGWENLNSRSNITDVVSRVVDQVMASPSPAICKLSNCTIAPTMTTTVASAMAALGGSATAIVTLNTVTNNSADSNATDNATKGPPESPYDEWEQIVIAIILGILILFTIIGNCLVCISVAIVKRLQNPSNLLIVSLAVADLLVAILVMPFASTMELYGAWMLGPHVCDMWTTTDVLLCTASILNLCMISVDRYLVITRPFQYAMKRTPRHMGIMIAIVWGVSAVVSIPPVFGWKSPHQDYDCYISLDIGYQIYATLCAFYLPLIVMIFVYVKIWLVSSKIAKAEARSKVGSFDKGTEHLHLGRPSRDSGDSQILPNGTLGRNHHNDAGEDDASLEILPKNLDPNQLKRRRFTVNIKSFLPVTRSKLSSSRERKATKTLGIIMGCFTLCWLPFFILALYKAFFVDSSVPKWLDSVLMWLGYANSFLNPVIYARFNREFRTPFKEILCFRCKGINNRMRSESYVEQYGGGGGGGGPDPTYRDSLRQPMDCFVRYNSQGQTVVQIGNGSANSQSESKI